MLNRIFKILGDEKTLLIGWIFYVLGPVVEMVRYKYQFWSLLGNSHIEMFLKIGTKAYLWIFLLLNLLIMLVWSKNIIKKDYLKVKHYIILFVISLLTVLYEIVIRVILLIDQSHYSNYIFSTYGIRPDFLKTTSAINYIFIAIIIALFVSVYESTLKQQKNSSKKNKFYNLNVFNKYTIINVFSFVIIISMSIYPIVNIPVFIHESRQGYYERIGKEYLYIDALVNLTPNNSSIIHPPQSNEWPLFGNQPIDRYFLFPRTLISGKLVSDAEFLSAFDNIYFVIVSPTNSSPEWPTIDRTNKQIVFDGSNVIKYVDIVDVGVFSDKHVYKLVM